MSHCGDQEPQSWLEFPEPPADVSCWMCAGPWLARGCVCMCRPHVGVWASIYMPCEIDPQRVEERAFQDHPEAG